jgi:hypothetical protein
MGGLSTLIDDGKFKEVFRPDANTAAYAPPQADSDTTVVWGKAGASPFQLQANVALEVIEERTEVQRTYDVVRVTDPNNEDNHIDMEVMTSYTSVDKNGGSRLKINLDRATESENVKVMERDRTRVSG